MRLSAIVLVGSLLVAACGAAPAGVTTPTAAASQTPAVPAQVTPIATDAPTSVPPTPAAATTPSTVLPAPVLVTPRDRLRVVALPRAPGDGTRTVVLDPGHAEDEVGAAANGVVEKTSNLDMAIRVEAVLAPQGVRVVLTRRADERAFTGAAIAGFSTTRRDLQARIDLANEVKADLFVSLHSNGALSTAERGVETYYNGQRPFSEQNRALATTIQASVVSEMANAGYPVTDRGSKDDQCLRFFQGRCFPLFVLGPARVTTGSELTQTPASPGQVATGSRATEMPGALVELLFISSPADAALLRADESRDVLARGIARGILEFLPTVPVRTE